MAEDIVEPLKVPRRVVRARFAAGRDPYAAAGVAAVAGDRGRIRHGPGVLGVEICPRAYVEGSGHPQRS